MSGLEKVAHLVRGSRAEQFHGPIAQLTLQRPRTDDREAHIGQLLGGVGEVAEALLLDQAPDGDDVRHLTAVGRPPAKALAVDSHHYLVDPRARRDLAKVPEVVFA